jgi:hypothetical protein
MIAGGSLKEARLAIVGEACTASGAIKNLTINGQAIAVGGRRNCEAFTQEQNSRWGLSIVTGRAEDERGNIGFLTHSYLRSPMAFPNATVAREDGRVRHAVFAQINQEVIDDGDRSDIDDVATVTSLMLNGVDWDGLIPHALHAQPDDSPADGEVDLVSHGCGLYSVTNRRTGFRLRKTGALTSSEVTVEQILAVEGGLDVSMVIRQLRLPLRVTGYLDLWCLGGPSASADGKLEADLIRANVHVAARPSVNGVPLVRPEAMEVEVIGFHSDIDLGPLFIIEFLLDELVGTFDPVFRSAVEDLIQTALAQNLGSATKAVLTEVLLPTHIDLALPTDTRLQLESGVDLLNFKDGYGQLGLYAQVLPTQLRSKVSADFGAIQAGGAPPTFSATDYAIGVGLKDDLLNQFLWAAWQGGAFDLEDIGEYASGLGLDGIRGATIGYLPPVVMPGSGGDDIELGIGDFYVDVSIGPELINAEAQRVSASVASLTAATGASFYVSAIIGASLDVDPQTNKLIVRLGRDPQVAVQVVTTDDPALSILIRNVLATLMHDILPVLLSDVVEGFELPSFDLSVVGPVPPGTILGLENVRLERQGRYHLLTGGVRQGSLP